MATYEIGYPKSFPAKALADGLSIIRAGEILERRSELGLIELNVQGFSQGMLLGDPEGLKDASTVWPTEDEQEILRAFVDEGSQAAGLAAGPLDRLQRLDWQKLFKFAIEVLIPLLLKV